MNMNTLDELTVPQPPYRMKRPEAVLAAAEEPVVASTEGEALPPPPPLEAAPPSPEAEPASPAEVIAERGAVIEAATQAARTSIETAPPVADATAEESQQDGSNRKDAVGKIDAASAEGSAKVQEAAARSYETLEDYEKEQKRLTQIAEDARAAGNDKRADVALKGALMLGPMVEKKRQQAREQAEAQAEAQERAQQEELARRADIEHKKSVTRGQTAAIKEDAVREEKKADEEMEKGVEFNETKVQRAGRIGREALADLNEFRNLKDLEEMKKVTPEQVEFARQKANRSQKQAEEAKLGKPISETKVDAAKIAAEGATQKQEAAAADAEKAKWVAEWTQEIKDAESFEDLYAKMRDAGEFLVSPSTGKPVDIEREIAIIENYRKTGNQFMAVEGGMGQSTRGLGVRDAAEALRTKEQPAVEEKPAKEKVKPTADELEAYQRKLRGEAPPAPPASTGLEEAFDAEGNLNLVPLEETPAAAPVPTEVGSERVDIKPGTPEGDAVAAARVAAEKFVAEKKAVPAEAAPAAPAERAPTAEEQIAQLREEIAQLKADRRQAAPEARAEQKEAPAEGGAEAAIRASIGEAFLKQKEKPSWFGQEWLKIQADGHNLARYWNSIWAKRAKDVLAERKTRLAELEKEAAEYSAKSWQNTAWAALKYAPRINWYKRGVESISTTLERREDERKRHEDSRAELLNLTVAREDASRKASEAEAGRYQKEVNIVDEGISKYYDKHRKATQEYADSTDPIKKQELLEEIAKIERLLRNVMQMRAAAQRKFSEQNAEAAQKQANQNKLLGLIDMAQQPDTSAGERRKEEVRKRPKRQPKAA